jgi:Bacterial Ig-like domain (group 3)
MEIHMAPHHLGCKSFIGPLRHGSRWFYQGLFSLLVLLVVAMIVPASFAQTAAAVITWNSPAAITYGTPLSGVQLNATATTIAPVIVSLPYNVDGISRAGQPVPDGGYDTNYYAFDFDLLGQAISWNGLTYSLGPADAPDAVSNTTITIPAAQQGKYASFVVLGSSVNNASSSTYSFTFTANYADGSVLLPQQMSDWAHPQDFPGESVAKCTPSRDGFPENGIPEGSQPLGVCVYAYQIPLDPKRVLQSITLPTTRKVVVLAMGLIPRTVPGTFAYNPTFGRDDLPVGTNPLSVQFTATGSSSPIQGPSNVSVVINPATPTVVWPSPQPISYGTPLSSTQLDATATVESAVIVPLSPYYNVNSFYPSGQDAANESTNGGFDCEYHEYSSTLDGTSIPYNGINFPLGTAGEPDSVSSSFCGSTGPVTSTIVALPAGSFTTLSMLGAATVADQVNQTFKLTYTDPDNPTAAPTTVLASLSLSNWTKSSGYYSGETVVSTTTNPHSPVPPASQVAGPVNIYGYQIPVDSTKTLQSITLPANRDVVIFAMALSSSPLGSPAAIPVPSSDSSFVYNPPSGTNNLPVGTDTLSVAFTSPDTTDVPDTQTSIAVTKTPVIVSISFSAPSITAGSSATITVNVASTTTGTPTGTVTLLDNGNAFGSPITLVNGVATYSTTTLPIGVDTITAIYSGDNDFNPGTASATAGSNTITVTAAPVLDFTFTATSSTLVKGTYGTPQQLTFHLAPIGGAYPSTVLFNAISPPGFAATYTFSPVSVAQNAGATDITLTVLANGPTALNSTPSWTGKRSAIGFAFLLLPFLGLRYSRSSGRRLTRIISCVILMALSLGAVGLVTGCGSDSYEQVYQITVTATSGTDQHAVGVNYEVPVQGH